MKHSTCFLAAAMLMLTTVFFAGFEKNDNDLGGGNWVDLGLPSGLLWATRNVGATSPEEYGDYFAWGETIPKYVYNWDNYRYCKGQYNWLTKYCNMSDYGYCGPYSRFTDDLTTLQPSDDAATVNWGGDARTPTEAEWEELIDHTTAQWTTRNGVNGRLFTGANGNSLFLPAAGGRDSSLAGAGSVGRYWSSSLSMVFPSDAICFGFGSDVQATGHGYRYFGFCVRAVRQN